MLRVILKKAALAAGALAVGALIVSLVLPKSALAEKPPLRLISVTGEAEIQVKPDLAVMSFGVGVREKSAQEAQEKNAELMTRVVSSLKQSGIPEEDIQTSSFSLYPEYEWIEEKPLGRQVLAGYRCSNQVVVRIHLGEEGQALVGDVLDAAVSAGANSVGGITFTLSDPGNLKDEVLAEAVKNAKAKAQVMAKAAGVTVTGIHRIYDGYTYVSDGMLSKGVFDGYSIATPVEAGTVKVSASVYIDFVF